MELTEAMAHAGNVYPRGLTDRAREALPGYMWTEGRPRQRTGYCSICLADDIRIDPDRYIPDWVSMDPYAEEDAHGWHHPKRLLGFLDPWKCCGHDMEKLTNSGRHLDYGVCPACGNLVQYRSLGMRRKTMMDRIFLIRYKRSEIDENALVMLGYLVICDWGRWNEYESRLPEIYIDLREICVFRPGSKGERFNARVHKIAEYTKDGYCITKVGYVMEHRKECVGGYDPWTGAYGCWANTPFLLDQNSVDAALEGTPWRALYALCGDEGYLDCINFFARAMRWPCLEYLVKLGYKELAKGVIKNNLPPQLLNLRGKNAQAVLRVDPDFYGWLKGRRIDAKPALLQSYHAMRNMGLRIGNDALLRLSSARGFEPQPLVKLSGYLREKTVKAIRYANRNKVALDLYVDHVRMMKELKIPWSEEQILFPRAFANMHKELSDRLRAQQDKAAAEKMKKRVEELAGWRFSALGLTIRPMETAEEIIREGNALHHCVGGYVSQYANGGTVILCLRKDEEIDKPWRTVEFTPGGTLVQCRGYRNQSPAEEQGQIDEFMKLYQAHLNQILKKKKKGRAAA